MKIFNDIIAEIAAYKDARCKPSVCRILQAENYTAWPGAGNRDIILMPDLAVEFGSPETASVSFGVWTGDDALVHDGRVTLIGPDATETLSRQNPFGKIVIAGVKGFDETNAFERNRELFLKKFDLALKGHMLRSASHYLAEWHRVSRAAVDDVVTAFRIPAFGAIVGASIVFGINQGMVQALHLYLKLQQLNYRLQPIRN